MSETNISLLIISILGYLFAFGCGYFLCKSRGKGLADNSGVCDKLTDTIEGSKERTDQLENKLGDLIESGSDIEAIFNKYAESTPEDKELE